MSCTCPACRKPLLEHLSARLSRFDARRIEREGQAQIIAKAQTYADKPERIRFQMVTALIVQARSFGYEIETEIFEAAGYESANEYWRVAMSEPMTALKFVGLLVRHQFDPRPNKENSRLRLRLAEALKIATEAREPWLVVNGAISWIQAEDEGVGWRVPDGLMLRDPKEAAKWMLGLLRLQPLIPPGLRDFIEDKQESNDPEPVYSSGTPGRPTSMHLIQLEMRQRAKRGELQSTLKAESESLSQWLAKDHLQMPSATPKTIQNNLRHLYTELSPK